MQKSINFLVLVQVSGTWGQLLGTLLFNCHVVSIENNYLLYTQWEKKSPDNIVGINSKNKKDKCKWGTCWYIFIFYGKNRLRLGDIIKHLNGKNRTPIGSSEKKKSYLASNKCK